VCVNCGWTWQCSYGAPFKQEEPRDKIRGFGRDSSPSSSEYDKLPGARGASPSLPPCPPPPRGAGQRPRSGAHSIWTGAHGTDERAQTLPVTAPHPEPSRSPDRGVFHVHSDHSWFPRGGSPPLGLLKQQGLHPQERTLGLCYACIWRPA